MPWAEFPALPLGGGIGAAFWLLVWLIRRGDGQVRSALDEVRRQRDEALDKVEVLEGKLEEKARALVEAEDELHVYRRAHGPLAD